MTRRLNGLKFINQNPDDWSYAGQTADGFGVFWSRKEIGTYTHIKCPYGVVGDYLWFRETFLDEEDYPCSPYHEDKALSRWIYRADIEDENKGKVLTWKPSIFMPRIASRFNPPIVNIRAERLQEITEADAKAEGVELTDELTGCADDLNGSYRKAFSLLWHKINGEKSWIENPFVWVVEFKKI